MEGRRGYQQHRSQLALSMQKEQARENAHAARPRENGSNRSVYSFGLPHISEAPKGARIIDGGGVFAVAMALGGIFVGLYRRL